MVFRVNSRGPRTEPWGEHRKTKALALKNIFLFSQPGNVVMTLGRIELIWRWYYLAESNDATLTRAGRVLPTRPNTSDTTRLSS